MKWYRLTKEEKMIMKSHTWLHKGFLIVMSLFMIAMIINAGPMGILVAVVATACLYMAYFFFRWSIPMSFRLFPDMNPQKEVSS